MKTIYFIAEIDNETGKGHYSRMISLFNNLNYEKKFLYVKTNSKNYSFIENIKFYNKNFFNEINFVFFIKKPQRGATTLGLRKECHVQQN